MDETVELSRRLWEAIEPIHAVVYFDPAVSAESARLGLRGFWMSYFAGRFAPMGPVPPSVVGALAFGFAPTRVERAIPDAWVFCVPESVLETRLAAAAASLRSHLDSESVEALSRMRTLIWSAVEGCAVGGRALAAAWSSVPRQDDPVADVWLAATILREHRGDGHVIAATSAGLSGLESLVTHVGTGRIPRSMIQPARGWSDGQWDAAAANLHAKGVIDGEGSLTATGRDLRRGVEYLTDRLAVGPTKALGDGGSEELIDLAWPLSAKLISNGVIPVPNPVGMGLSAPD